jgi:hypothetical protein
LVGQSLLSQFGRGDAQCGSIAAFRVHESLTCASHGSSGCS